MLRSMHVLKRDGTSEAVSFDKVLRRIQKAAAGLSVQADALAQRVLSQIFDGVKTTDLDELAAQLAASLSTLHSDYATLASRLTVSNHHKNTEFTFAGVVSMLANQTSTHTDEPIRYVSEELEVVACAYADEIEAHINYQRDYDFDYFGFKTLERSYLLKDTKGRILERPQHMWMRVALGLWTNGDKTTAADLAQAYETYDLMSQKIYTHATPTLFNAGTPRPQLSSCFLMSMSDDSIAGIYKTLGDCAAISKYAGGIGLHCHNVRARGSLIKGTNGTSNGLVPMLRVFNNTARYVDQGGGKRNGSFAIYLEPWHADIDDFLKMKLNSGAEEERARDLFYALWIPDLFMRRVEEDGVWSLFCPNEAPGLADVYGDEFDALYTRYEKEGRARKTVSAQKLWFKVLDSQMETGTPYLLYKDPANKKSNQKNLGTIKSSNLCTEIMEYSSPEETAVCNLASIALPAFVSDDNKTFDFVRLRAVVASAVKALNRVIDINFYPTPETKRSNMRHRPIGMGIQGLADVFARLRMPWESPEAARMNQLIFEHMYFAAVEASMSLAIGQGFYETFKGSPASLGQLQPDLWGVTPITESEGTLDWKSLRLQASRGMRNSLLMAPMPTASTSQILGYTECFEPMTTNIYTRRTLAGEYVVVNRYLMEDLMNRGLWSESLKQRIIAQNGSVQGIKEISDDLQAIYKTSWEIKQRALIDMAAKRGAFICQSQSLNLSVENPTYAKLTSMHFYAWKQGLKTGCYYLRTKAPVMAQKFTVDPQMLQAASNGRSVAPGRMPPAPAADDDDSDSESEDEEITAEEKKAKARAALRDRLAREYEEAAAEANAAAASGEGCTMCSS
jgi:ribonucleoside-diphosphate reductase alpha subunit